MSPSSPPISSAPPADFAGGAEGAAEIGPKSAETGEIGAARKRQAALTRLAAGEGQAAVVEAVWGVKRGGGEKWNTAVKEMRAILADAATRALQEQEG